jgi:hypothetical protein
MTLAFPRPMMRCVFLPAHVVQHPRRKNIATGAEVDVRPGPERQIHEAIAAARHHSALTRILEEAADA